MTEAIPWYKSRILLGLLVSVVCKLLVVTGVTGEIGSDVETQIVDIAVTLVGLVGDSQILLARVQQVEAPTITATQGKATQIVVDKAAATELVNNSEATGEVPSWMKP